jgi:hypothetical protein
MFKRRAGRVRKEDDAPDEKMASGADAPVEGKLRRKRADEGNKNDSGGWMNLTSEPNKTSTEPTIEFEESIAVAQNKDKHFQENNDEILVSRVLFY